ncbi:hypothetical protein [Phaeobacter porticola]|uniref:Tat pathway signal sequence domain protein n=1 Tax=Phaeobacter porticola TaxID=1844006 RepID=A0A1L3IAH9_9RHOB|nr:hypothetical protein [Phaeobacter porticola]APG49072.1 hypothetical protein PhaeoP97_03722 [Phaeobacter porticola]
MLNSIPACRQARVTLRTVLAGFALMGSLWPAGIAAETVPTAAPAALSIELSAAQADGHSCLLSFVAQNGHQMDVAQAVFETVLFDAAGQVSQLTLLDFQDLPAGRLRVRQFQFPMSCSDISRVLINGAETCQGEGLPEGACSRGLTLTTKAMELAG